MKKLVLYITVLLSIVFLAKAQEPWVAPASEDKKLSPFLFNEEMKAEGLRIYENSCASCHGIPGTNNFAKLSPSPGDPASANFQAQSDGSLYYKIRKGRGTMPAFEKVLGEEETWNVIAYIRDFNKNYVQKTDVNPNDKPVNLTAHLSYDDNIYNLVVRVLADSAREEGIKVSAFVKSNFGTYPLPKASTNKEGIAYIPVEVDLPTDAKGNLVFFVKISKGTSSLKVTDTLHVNPEPVIKPAITEGEHLWSPAGQAPLWLKITFWGTVIGIWTAIVFVVTGLLKIKKLK